MTVASDNEFPSVLLLEGDPEDLAANPAAGQRRLAVGADHLLYLVDDAGVATLVGGGLTDPMTTRGDVIIRNASNATARLAKGAADTYLGSDGTDVAYSAVTDAKLSTSDITTNNATTSKHGFLRKLDNNAAHFLDGTGAWATPGGAGSTGARYPVQTGSVASASGTTRAITFAATPTNGNVIYAVTLSESTDAVTSIAQTNVTWTKLMDASAGVAPVLELWKGVVAASAGTTMTVTWGGTAFHSVIALEFSGTAGTLSSSATRHVTNDATGQHPVPLLTPSNITDLIIAAASTASNGTTFSGYTGVYLVIAETGRTLGVAWGFPGSGSVYGSLAGGSSATATGLTASIA